MSLKASKPSGGLKGFFQKTGTFLVEHAAVVRARGLVLLKWGYETGGSVAFALATTSMVVLMPLLFEIAREGQVRE